MDGGCNVYLAGFAQGTLPGQSPSGDIDAFVRKYDHQGNEMWTRQFGTSGGDAAYGLAVDGGGNVYVSGSVWGSLPGQTSAGVYDAFLRKYDPQGKEVWTRQFGSTLGDGASAVVVDGAGSVYVSSTTQTSAGPVDVFLSKYNPQGKEVWTRQFGREGSAVGVAGLAVDRQGNVYAAGGARSGGEGDVFLRKYDAQGNEVWNRQLGPEALAVGVAGLAVDRQGNVYVAGSITGSFPGYTFAGWTDAFVRKYNSQGSEVWTRQFGSAFYDAAGGVAVDGAGSVYVGGTLDLLHGQRAGGFVRKYDPDGTEVWTRLPGPSGDDHVQGVVTDVAGNLYVAGSAFVTKLSGAPPTPTPTPTPTPSPTPRATPRPTGTPDTSGLVFTITVVPSEPRVGDIVRVTAYASGQGGLPQYRLRIEPSGLLRSESPDAVSTSQLGVPVSWDLRALKAGKLTLQVWVNYETQFCVPTHCVYQFTNAYADPIRVRVRDNLALTVTAIGDQGVIRHYDSDKCAFKPAHVRLDPIATFTYPNTGDTHTAVIEWGDGTVQPGIVTESGGSGTVSGDHDYSFDGRYTVTITLTDNHGAAGDDAVTVTVIHVDRPDEPARCVR